MEAGAGHPVRFRTGPGAQAIRSASARAFPAVYTASRMALQVRSIISSEWAAETNMASNWEGAT